MISPAQWWLDHRSLGKIVDGTFVESPQRLERAWAWLLTRRNPTRPPRRITVLLLWALLVVTVTLDFSAPRLIFAIGGVLWFLAPGVAFLLVFQFAGLGVASLRKRHRRGHL